MKPSAYFPDDLKEAKEVFWAAFAELFATAAFVFLGTGSVTATGEFLRDGTGEPMKSSTARIIPIATTFGIAISVLAYNIGAISGGHINPAVTIALCCWRKISPLRSLIYILSQLVGAMLGSALLWGGISNVSYYVPPGMNISDYPGFIEGVSVVPSVGYPPYSLGANELNEGITEANGLLLEFIGTCVLCATVLLTAVDGRSLGKLEGLAPIPIGWSIWVVHLVLIPWTGCGINPARTFGPMMVNFMAGNDTYNGTGWIYYVGPVVGALVSATLAGGMAAHYTPAAGFYSTYKRVDEAIPDSPMEEDEAEKMEGEDEKMDGEDASTSAVEKA